MNNRIDQIFEEAKITNYISNDEYKKWGVKKGLRNEDGTGVLVGLTRIADVVGYKMENGEKVDDYGKLLYRGIQLSDIVEHIDKEEICGFEEISFLILFGHLPNREELKIFREELQNSYALPAEYLSVNILSNPSMNVMNKIQRSLLMLYEMDDDPDETSPENTIRQGIRLIGKLPAIICYGYQAKKHLLDKGSMVIHHIDKKLSIAETILSLLRDDRKYTREEAELLDTMLVVHIDHGAGNNSTFSSIVVSSTGTDLYSAISAAVGSLKGPKHGGANLSVRRMFEAVIKEIGTDASDDDIRNIIEKILDKDFYDRSGLVYGIGHAVYTLSDPRAEIIKKKARTLAEQKGQTQMYSFLLRFEEIAKELIYQRKGKRVCANVDFYSGFVYDLLGIPEDLFTPMFVMARTTGWIAHIIENKLYCSKIVRPAGKYVGNEAEYTAIEDRK